MVGLWFPLRVVIFECVCALCKTLFVSRIIQYWGERWWCGLMRWIYRRAETRELFGWFCFLVQMLTCSTGSPFVEARRCFFCA